MAAYGGSSTPTPTTGITASTACSTASHPGERIVWTFEPEDFPGHVCLETITFGERGDKTVVNQNTVYQSAGDRDAAAASDMEEGINESMERLDQLLARLVPVN